MMSLSRKLRIAVSAYVLWMIFLLFTNGLSFEDIFDWGDSDIRRFKMLCILPPLFVLTAYLLLRWCVAPEKLRISPDLARLLKMKARGTPKTSHEEMVYDLMKLDKIARKSGKTLMEAEQEIQARFAAEVFTDGKKFDAEGPMTPEKEAQLEKMTKIMLEEFGVVPGAAQSEQRSAASPTSAEAVEWLKRETIKRGYDPVTGKSLSTSSPMTARFVPRHATSQGEKPASQIMREMFSEKGAALVEYIQAHNWVCPQHDVWLEIWKSLPDRADGTQIGGPVPEAAWVAWPDVEKHSCLLRHIKYADEVKAIDQLDHALRQLAPEKWLVKK